VPAVVEDGSCSSDGTGGTASGPATAAVENGAVVDRRRTTYVISITPFDADAHVDEAALRAHLERMADANLGVYVGGSGSGEGYALTAAETRRVLEIAAATLGGRVPVRAMGVEPRNAAEMVALVRNAQAAGVDAAQIYSLDLGHGRVPRPDEQEAYFRDVLDAVTFACVISTHQSVGYFLDPELIGRLLGDYPHVIGVHCTHPDLGYLIRVLDVVGDRAEVHVGGPMHALAALALGAHGYLVSEANLVPRVCGALTTAWTDNDLAAAAAAYATIMRLFAVVQANGGVSGIKAALAVLGLPGGRPRRPRLEVPETWAKAIVDAVDRLGVRATEGW
jgi:4-hydroxy-tetrahydrodipicolinate synthase